MANIKISELPALSQLANTTQFPVANANVTYAVTASNMQAYMSTYPGGIFSGAIFSATGNVIAAGNVQGGNIRTTGLVSVAGNITSGNINTGRAVITTADITTGNVTTLNTDAINLTGNLTGGTITGITDLAVVDGGTGRSALTSSAVLVGNGTGAVNFVSPGASGSYLTSNGTNWVSQAFNSIPTFSIVFQGEISVNAINTFTVNNNKATVLFVYFGNGAGGNQFLFSNVEWGMPGLNQQRVWYGSGVDFQVAQSGSLLASFNAGSGTSLQIRVNANNLGAYGAPGSARCLIYQM